MPAIDRGRLEPLSRRPGTGSAELIKAVRSARLKQPMRGRDKFYFSTDPH